MVSATQVWTVLGEDGPCICCGGTTLTQSPAILMPFVAERVLGHRPLLVQEAWGLRDIAPGTAHSLCHSLQCQSCGALFLDHRFNPAQMQRLYAGYRDERYTRERERHEPGYAQTAAHYQGRADYLMQVEHWLAPRLPKSPVVLDWGGGNGQNTLFLGRSQANYLFDIAQAEPVPGVIAVDQAQLSGREYDLLVCSQVLEHVSDPLALLATLRTGLTARTLLYLEVPHEALMREHPRSMDLARHKHHWHEHINFFTQTALHRLLQRAGLSVIDTLSLDIELGWRRSSILGLLARLE